MAIEWDVLEGITRLSIYQNGNWTRYYGDQTPNITLFPDELHENDAIYFSCNGYNHPSGYSKSISRPFSGIKVNLAEPVDGDYNYVWEYYSSANNDWNPLPNVNDPSNGLRNAGEHIITWDVPHNWYLCGSSDVGGDFYSGGWVVRLRIYNVSSGSGGGKQANEEIQSKNYAITIRDGNTYTMQDIYDSGLGFVDKLGINDYRMMNNLMIENGELILDNGVYLEVSDRNHVFMIDVWGDGKLTMDNSTLMWFSPGGKSSPYNYWSGLWTMRNGAKYGRRYGGYVTHSISGQIDIQDSEFYSMDATSPSVLLNSVAVGSIKRTNFALKYLYGYTPWVEFDDIRFITTDRFSANYYMNGSGKQTVYLANSNLGDNVYVYANQRSETIVLDCANANRSNFDVGSTYNTGTNYVWEAYTLKIKVLDENNNPIENAKVEVYDKNGHTALVKDWYKTDHVRLERISNKDENHLKFLPSRPDYFDVGTVFRIRGEYLRITNVSGNYVDVERHVSYNGYDSLTVGGHGYYPPVRTEEPYILTNTDGEAKFTGPVGDVWPIIFTYVKANDYDYTTAEREYGPTFTVRVSKKGYETYESTLNITEPTSLLVILRKSQSVGILDFKDVILHLNPDKRSKLWMRL